MKKVLLVAASLILLGQSCANQPKTTSSCQYDGADYKEGSSFAASDGCNTCFCENGQVSCTEIFCPSEAPVFSCVTDQDCVDDANIDSSFCPDGSWQCDAGECVYNCSLGSIAQ